MSSDFPWGKWFGETARNQSMEPKRRRRPSPQRRWLGVSMFRLQGEPDSFFSRKALSYPESACWFYFFPVCADSSLGLLGFWEAKQVASACQALSVREDWSGLGFRVGRSLGVLEATASGFCPKRIHLTLGFPWPHV